MKEVGAGKPILVLRVQEFHHSIGRNESHAIREILDVFFLALGYTVDSKSEGCCLGHESCLFNGGGRRPADKSPSAGDEKPCVRRVAYGISDS